MNETVRPSRPAALAAVDLAGGVALYPLSPGIGLLLAVAGVLVLCAVLHGVVREADPVGTHAPRRP